MNVFGLQQQEAEVLVEVERRELILLQIQRISHLVSYQFYFKFLLKLLLFSSYHLKVK